MTGADSILDRRIARLAEAIDRQPSVVGGVMQRIAGAAPVDFEAAARLRHRRRLAGGLLAAAAVAWLRWWRASSC